MKDFYEIVLRPGLAFLLFVCVPFCTAGAVVLTVGIFLSPWAVLPAFVGAAMVLSMLPWVGYRRAAL